jgi:transposase
METVFSEKFTRAQIRSIWRTSFFGDRTTCPRCDYQHKHWQLDDDRWRCARCKKTFGLRTDTWIADVSYSLKEIVELLYWFELDITDHKIAERIDEPYSSVHRFLMRVREAIQVYEDRLVHPLDGEVEVDETYFGASFKNRRRSKREELRKSGQVKRGRGANALQQAVFGIYERTDGLIYVEPVEDVTKETLQDIIDNRVSIETTIYSDTWRSYQGLDETFKDHETVNHNEHEYSRGSASINGIEGFWAYAKERIIRSHGIGPDHLIYYLKEIEFRFNHQDLDSDEFVKQLLHVLAQTKN